MIKLLFFLLFVTFTPSLYSQLFVTGCNDTTNTDHLSYPQEYNNILVNTLKEKDLLSTLIIIDGKKINVKENKSTLFNLPSNDIKSLDIYTQPKEISKYTSNKHILKVYWIKTDKP